MASGTVSDTRLYLGNLNREATKEDVRAHFEQHGTGEIKEIKLMSGFGFIEYADAMDARDVVPAFHGSTLLGERLTVQFARGSKPHRDPAPNGASERGPPRPRRTKYRMEISNLPTETSWQDLKDFARRGGVDVVYSETGRERDKGYVEFETEADLMTAIEKLNNTDFKDTTVTCVAQISEPTTREYPRRRSRSPRGRYPPPEGYDRRRGYTPPPRDPYRARSPPRRDEYYRRGYEREPYGDPYPPRPGRGYDDPYYARPRDPYREPYASSGYPPYPERDRSPGHRPPRPAPYEYERERRPPPAW
ncbi:MAG: hypothetical protein M1824_005132 [Vezdaea acicularis]|nr:MAG: hypothetical protein M1824_005132 [Vezdaea acicularis]